MNMGSDEYRTTLRRWAELFDIHPRTFEQEIEFDALHRRLDAAERQSVIARVTSDYGEAMRNANHLGVCEL